MPPRKNLKNRCTGIESKGILESIYLAIQCVLTCKINVKYEESHVSITIYITYKWLATPLWHGEYTVGEQIMIFRHMVTD